MLKSAIPTGLTGAIAVLILSASMSTLSSVSLAGASVIAVDIYGERLKHGASPDCDRRVNIAMKLLCLAFVAVSIVLAVLNEKFGIAAIAYMMGISWGTLAGCFIGPYVLGVLWRRVSRAAVWTSVISSPVITATLIVIIGYDKCGFSASFGEALKAGVSSSPMIGVICMLFSLAATFLVSLFTKAPKEEIIHEAFGKSLEG